MLCAGPDLELAVTKHRGGIWRLHRRVREERIFVVGLQDLRGGGECRVRVTIGARRAVGGFLRQLDGAGGKRGAAVGGRDAVVPRHLKLLARVFGVPPAVGDDRDAAHGVGAVAVGNDEGVSHTRHRRDGIKVRAQGLAANDRAPLIHRVQHPGQCDVAAKQRLAGDDLEVVDTRQRLADDVVPRRVLEREGVECRGRDARGRTRELAVSGGAV